MLSDMRCPYCSCIMSIACPAITSIIAEAPDAMDGITEPWICRICGHRADAVVVSRERRLVNIDGILLLKYER